MAALGINVSTRDTVYSGHGLPSGRSNLVGQQKTARLSEAQAREFHARKEYEQARDDYENGLITADTVDVLYDRFDAARDHVFHLQRSEIISLFVDSIIAVNESIE